MWQETRARCVFLHVDRVDQVGGERMRWRAIRRAVRERFSCPMLRKSDPFLGAQPQEKSNRAPTSSSRAIEKMTTFKTAQDVECMMKIATVAIILSKGASTCKGSPTGGIDSTSLPIY